MKKILFYIATLGCKVNQYESHALREAWIAGGWQEAEAPEKASRILVNSCAVTAKAVADVRNTVRRLNRAAPGADIIVSGCAAQVLGKELADLPGVVKVVAQENKSLLLGMPSKAPEAMSAVPPSIFPPFSLSGYDRSRAVLKVQDGCSHGCTYCIVPLSRGRARTREYADSLAETRRLLRAGFREITVSGVNLRQYHDKGGGDFWDFLRRLDADLGPEWAGEARLRVSSLEPGQLTDKALDTLAGTRLVAPHLHLSLQSGSSGVLRQMGRGHYDPAALPSFLEKLRGLWPLFGLGADILTGFPGESEEQFREGLALCASLPLSYAHVFPYSRRPGTSAAAMSPQVAPAVKKERAAVLRSMVAEKKQVFLESLLSLPGMEVVFEARNQLAAGAHHHLMQGINEFYADCRLEEGGASVPEPGRLTRVKATGVKKAALLVRLA